MTNYNFILERLFEGSTVRGMVLLLSSIIAPNISASDVDSIVFFILGFVGILGMVLPDKLIPSTPSSKEDKK